MYYDHEAIRRAYPEVVTIADNVGIFKEDGTEVTIVQSKVDAARVTLNAEASAIAYRYDRRNSYPDIGDQLDDLYKKGAFSDEMSAKIKAVKDKYPKPS